MNLTRGIAFLLQLLFDSREGHIFENGGKHIFDVNTTDKEGGRYLIDPNVIIDSLDELDEFFGVSQSPLKGTIVDNGAKITVLEEGREILHRVRGDTEDLSHRLYIVTAQLNLDSS